MFHGSILIDFNLSLIQDLLKIPEKQPDYRKNRKHSDFLTNIHISREKIKEALKKEWHAEEELKEIPRDLIRKLVDERYSRNDWNFKF